jgi:hypothetical protein
MIHLEHSITDLQGRGSVSSPDHSLVLEVLRKPLEYTRFCHRIHGAQTIIEQQNGSRF